MSKILRVSESDYRVKVVDGGQITLDTGTNGIVRVTGNLQIDGDYTTVNVADMQVEDNIILLNKGETGVGVGEGTSGIEIDRGSLDNVQLVWDETQGTFVVQDTLAVLKDLRVNSLQGDPSGNIQFDLQNGTGTLKVINSTGYETRVVDDNDITTKKYVNTYVAALGGSAIVNKLFYPLTVSPGNEDTLIEALTSNITFSVRSGGTLNQRAQIASTGLDVDNINIYNDTITNTTNNLVLTALNSNVDINGILNLIDYGPAPTAVSGRTKLWYGASSLGAGRTGIFFTNPTPYGASSTSSDELVAKNRALLFSMLF